MQIILVTQILIIWVVTSFNTALSQSQSIDKRLSPFDTIFQPALNSPAYVVASKDKVNSLRKYFENEISKQIQTTELKEEEIIELNNSLDSLIKITSQYKPLTQSSSKIDFSTILIVVNLALFIVIVGLFFNGFQTRKSLKEGKDSYVNLEKEFDLHKKNAIERERRLMRKVIDLQNEMDNKPNTDN
jgi:hypothetical protein